MQFSKDQLKQKFRLPLPGLVSHMKMAPKHRVQELFDHKDLIHNATNSAVLILFFHDDNQLKMIVIRRSNYVGIHAGQIAFPGGRYEPEDIDLQNTALREIEEEIGIERSQIQILGRLSDIYVPTSHFLISVFVGYLDKKPQYIIQHREVAEVLEISFAEFMKPDLIKTKDFFVDSLHVAVNAPYYDFSNAPVWGASAMVISELIDVLRS